VVNLNYISQIEAFQAGEFPTYDLDALGSLCLEYPCFQSAFLLKAICLKQADNIKFEEELPALAVRVLNRSVLYDRVHEQYGESKLISNEAVADDHEEEHVVDAELNEIIEKAEVLQAEEATVTENLIQENQVQVSETDASDSDDQNNLQALVAEINRKRKEAPIVTKTPKIEEKQLIKLKVKKKKAPSKTAQVEMKKPVPEVQINSFTDWLKNKKSVETNELLEESTKPLVPIDMAMSHEAALMREVKKSNFKLEDFLVDQIERKQSKKEEGRSAFMHAVSETYAKILVSQDKIEDAINVYKELSIKYPKKSSNFARQIKNLKNN
jgi:hypothetical protein